MFSKLSVFTAVLVLLAGVAVGASQATRLDGFQLVDQNGAPTEIAPSAQATLVYFYRGDW